MFLTFIKKYKIHLAVALVLILGGIITCVIIFSNNNTQSLAVSKPASLSSSEVSSEISSLSQATSSSSSPSAAEASSSQAASSKNTSSTPQKNNTSKKVSASSTASKSSNSGSSKKTSTTSKTSSASGSIVKHCTVLDDMGYERITWIVKDGTDYLILDYTEYGNNFSYKEVSNGIVLHFKDKKGKAYEIKLEKPKDKNLVSSECMIYPDGDYECYNCTEAEFDRDFLIKYMKNGFTDVRGPLKKD